MCDTCSQTAVDVLKMDLYSHMTAKRDEVLADEEMREVFGEAFEELIQNYAMFVQKVFDGQFEPESIKRRQKQWEERLEVLVTQIAHGVPEEPEAEEPQPQPEALIIGAPKKNPFSAWANKQ